MGYRSKVVIAVKKKHLPDLVLVPGLETAFRHSDTIDYDKHDARYWQFDGIKWYSSSTIVTVIERWLQSLPSESDYGFLRLGEEPEDAEFKGEPWNFDIYHHAYISSPLD